MERITIEVTVSNGYVGCSKTEAFEFNKESWADMSENEREKAAMECMFEMIEWDYEVK